MEEKKKKKFIIPLPYTGGNLGKTLMFGLVIILAVVGAMMLQAKELTQIQEDGYVVEEELSDALKNGVTDPVSQDEVELYAVSAWQKVYSRMGSLYVGEEQQKFQKTYPEFLESGSGVRFLDDEATLIGEDMTTRLPVYDGLRVNNGNTFGEDGIQAYRRYIEISGDHWSDGSRDYHRKSTYELSGFSGSLKKSGKRFRRG